ncbi:MAG: radical SAM protein [Planctomycetota bacterium]|nr:radical SAM protein [Planctomycetota bacterium]
MIDWFRRRSRQESFVFEVTTRCHHECLHCYNAWKNGAPYPAGELATEQTLKMLGRMLDQTQARLVTLSGGEPLLRTDLGQIVDYLAGRGVASNLICNGTLLDAAAIERIGPRRVSVFELPLLSVEREIHDRMSGAAGAFDKVTMAVAELKAAGATVVTVFVATKLNLPTWRATAELAIALGADGIMFNRFNPGGEGGRNVGLLQASPAELTAALDVAEELATTYEMPISCSIAMPPCLFDTGKYKRLTFGFCAAGSERAYYTLDPVGNVRPCNHSPRVLGNIRTGSFRAMTKSAAMKSFVSARPAFCGGCELEVECQGGCKAAAEACYGDASLCDPFLGAFAGQAVKLTAKDG